MFTKIIKFIQESFKQNKIDFIWWNLIEKLDDKDIDNFLSSIKDLNAFDKQGETILISAVALNKELLIKTLVNNGADINLKNKKGETPLITASHCFTNIVFYLAEKDNLHINLKDKFGRNALFIVSQYFNLPLMEVLLNHGSDINNQDTNGMTPLMNLISGNDTWGMAAKETIDVILSYKPNLLLKNNAGFTAIDFMIQKK